MAKPVSPLLSTVVLVVGFGVLVGAAWVGYSTLVVLLGLALAAALVAKLWSYLCLKGVTCERRLSEHRVFPDDEVLLTLRVVNRKLLPLPWVEIQDEVPAALLTPSKTPDTRNAPDTPSQEVDPSPAGTERRDTAKRPGCVTLSRSTSLLWYSAATFTHRLNAAARGYYPLGPVAVASGDIFGLHPRRSIVPDVDHLLVYPHMYALSELGIPSLSHLGDAKAKMRVFDDPARLLGVREYIPGDSPRHIHWKASARNRTLQVKLFEPTTDLKVNIFLATDTFADLPSDDLELGISAAASITRHLMERGVQTGFYANTRLADTQGPARIGASGDPEQPALILEALAKTTSEVSETFIDFFDRERDQLGFGGATIFIVGDVSAEMRLLVAGLVKAGRRVLGFRVGARALEAAAPGVGWHQVRRRATPAPAGTIETATDADFGESAVA